MVNQNDIQGSSSGYKSTATITSSLQLDKKQVDSTTSVSQLPQQRLGGYAGAVINGGVVQYTPNIPSVVSIEFYYKEHILLYNNILSYSSSCFNNCC